VGKAGHVLAVQLRLTWVHTAEEGAGRRLVAAGKQVQGGQLHSCTRLGAAEATQTSQSDTWAADKGLGTYTGASRADPTSLSNEISTATLLPGQHAMIISQYLDCLE